MNMVLINLGIVYHSHILYIFKENKNKTVKNHS